MEDESRKISLERAKELKESISDFLEYKETVAYRF
jgi:hypothetical protein